MATLSLADAIATALDHHRAGRLAQAEGIYRQILSAHPDQPDALHLLGVIAHQVGQHEQAIGLIGRAVQIVPTSPEFLNNLGEAYRAIGRFDDAMIAYRRAITLKPDYADPHANLGLVLMGLGQVEPASAALRRAIELNPRFPAAHTLLGRLMFEERRYPEAIKAFESAIECSPHDPHAYGNLSAVLKETGQLDEAERRARRGVEIAPRSPEAHYNLGVILQAMDRQDDALRCFEQAISLNPQYGAAYNNLALSFQAQRRLDDAVAALRRSVEFSPASPQAWCNLGAALHAIGESDDAIVALRRAIELQFNMPEAHANLALALNVRNRLREALDAANDAVRLSPMSPHAFMSLAGVLHKQGLTDDALLNYRRARDLAPDLRIAHQNVLLTLNYHENYDAQQIFDEHLAWADKFGRLDAPPAHSNDRDPDRRLRIGYVSPDLRQHSVAFFLDPILSNHDKSQVEVYCYSDTRKPDAVTDRFRSLSDHWHECRNRSHEELAALIRADQIDVLIDLAGHTSSNRLPALASKPAPVQVTYLGYPNTTGLKAIDYRITDAHADPVGMTDRYYTETLWRLPRCAWCYRPASTPPHVAPAPFLSAGDVTFGSFNKHPKLQPATIDAWAKILLAVPRSRLVLKSTTLGDDETRDRIIGAFASRGVDTDRVELLGSVAAIQDHLDSYRRIDIALDTFPYNGTTTTCDALFMGVPVVALAGKTHVSRVGVSLLNAVGLSELVADDADAYVRLATELAEDTDRLRSLRAGMRQRVESSALMDGSDMARQIESAYRQMWKTWCESGKHPSVEAS